MFKGLSTDITSDDAVYEEVNQEYPQQVVRARIVLELTDLLTFEQCRQNAVKRAQHFRNMALLHQGVDTADQGEEDEPPSLCSACLGQICPPLQSYQDRARSWETVRRKVDTYIDEWSYQEIKGTGIAFVTFRSPDAADRCLQRRVGPRNWLCYPAPEPNDIVWENLGLSWWSRKLRLVIVNVFIVLMLMLWSSPVTILTTIKHSAQQEDWYTEGWKRMEEWLGRLPGKSFDLINAYLPSVLYWLINTILLIALEGSSRLEGQYTQSRVHRSIMQKSFVFLLVNMLILPSLVLSSVSAIVTFSNPQDIVNMFGKMFLHTSAPLFINILIQWGFLGGALELLRLSEQLAQAWAVLMAVTDEERFIAKQTWPFEYGRAYAVTLGVFATALAYSTMVPLVSVAALFYFCVRHVVDKWNLLYVKPVRWAGRHEVFVSHITQSVVVGCLVYQFAMAGFFFVNHRLIPAALLFTLFGLTFGVFLTRCTCWVFVSHLVDLIKYNLNEQYWRPRRRHRRRRHADTDPVPKTKGTAVDIADNPTASSRTSTPSPSHPRDESVPLLPSSVCEVPHQHHHQYGATDSASVASTPDASDSLWYFARGGQKGRPISALGTLMPSSSWSSDLQGGGFTIGEDSSSAPASDTEGYGDDSRHGRSTPNLHVNAQGVGEGRANVDGHGRDRAGTPDRDGRMSIELVAGGRGTEVYAHPALILLRERRVQNPRLQALLQHL